MTKTFITGLYLILIFYSCVDNSQTKQVLNTSSFQTFEISYSDGWTRGFSFVVDTSKAFIASTKIDSIIFGVLPDSLFRLIDTSFSKIKSDTTIKSKDNSCVDCPLISLKAMLKTDTIRIFQTGSDIDKIFLPIIKRLQTLVDNSRHTTISTINWETQKGVLPSPTIIDLYKFKPPK